ncbi:S8 family serine peptidase [Promicromonospora thailandica]|uniref:Serine protease, subtilisin family n=1 Tax=Promicromonospora thailandica TaxID=765201 RepID=A0A9X2K0H7_9MICO|nr:S8 family serine peptidase [Promicromonospora thailandica]MCP2267109.1 Serine protease, subtilisin family [Promicromonospora thailandica]
MRRHRSVVAATAAALVVGVLPTAAAEGTAPPATPAAAGADQSPPSVPDTDVTLITGDRVTTGTAADGAPVVGFEAAPRPDGLPVTYEAFGDAAGHYFVVPSDVAALVPDKLDLRLFDVAAVDKAAGRDKPLPVIVQTTTARAARAAAPTWRTLDVEADRTLESIDAVAGDVPAEGAPALLDAVKDGATVGKVWLDAPLETTDADSTPQIGATDAWAEGVDGTGVTVAVLDSGIDTGHPDLDEGVVTLEHDFTGSGSTTDVLGHGTHVASIIAGTGEASDGENRGVAPGARLLNARVLNDEGQGEESWAIDAMEWAATNGADVINMSLGVRGGYTDGTDPSALAVDSISARYDTLVAIAAGNEGNGGTPFTVTTPGTADSALTVGAVSDDDRIAYFSSMGPRYGDLAIKPDITAPGDGIVAARAAGTSIGEPVGDHYAAMSGTSMATPHVAGAAALLKQARPDLDGEAMKSVLMGSAEPTGNSVFAEGAGRTWVPGAIAQTVWATPASLSFGLFDELRADQEPRTQTVTYTNDSDADVEVTLSLSLNAGDGEPVPAGVGSLSTDTLTVPAHGTASADVTVDPRADDPDLFAGVLRASGPGFPTVRTVLAFQVDPDMYTLRIEADRLRGTPARNPDSGWIHGIDDPDVNQWFQFTDGVAEVRLPAGRYAVQGQLFDAVSPEADFLDTVVTFTRDADLTTSGATLVLDGEPVPVRAETPRKVRPRALSADVTRMLPGRPWPVATSISASTGDYVGGMDLDAYVLPDTAPLAGDLTVTSRFLLDQPLLDVATTGKGKPLDVSRELAYAVRSPRYDGTMAARIVDGGTGTPEELAAVRAKGAVVLIEDTGDPSLNPQSQAARAAGAAALVVYGSTPGPFFHQVDNYTINTMEDQALPTLTLKRDLGLALLDAARRGATLRGTGRVTPAYQYVLGYHEDGRAVPRSLTYRSRDKDLAAVETELRSFKPFAPGLRNAEQITITSGSTLSGWQQSWPDGAVSGRTVYYSTEPGVRFQRDATAAQGLNAWPAWMLGEPVTYAPGRRAKETYNAAVYHGGFWPSPSAPQEAAVHRDGSTLGIDLPYRVDGAGHAQEWGPDEASTGRFRVWQGDDLLTDDAFGTYTTQDVGTGTDRFRIRLETRRETPWWPLSTDVTTEWGFTSGRTTAPAVLPLLQLDYGVQGLDAYNTTSRRTATLDLSVSHQDGAAGASPVTSLKLWSSADGGAHWTPVTVTPAGKPGKPGKPGHGGSGAYTATVTAPPGATTVSLRSEARDAAGATFSETVIDAYAVGR